MWITDYTKQTYAERFRRLLKNGSLMSFASPITSRPNVWRLIANSKPVSNLHQLQNSIDDLVSMGKKYELLAPVMLFLLGFFLRLGLLLVSVDIPGDGPSRAFMAYAWSKSPYFATHGTWLPGFLYLAGIFNFFVPDPLFASRVLNLILGSATIPLYYLLTRRLYNRIAALFASLLLVVLPLHVGLSVSSLADNSFLFATIASMVLLTGINEGKEGKLRLGLSLCLFCWAEMTRYEAWLLIPAFPIYYFHKTRKTSTAGLVLLILLLFPVGWMLENYVHSGEFLTAFSEVKKGAEIVGAHAVDLFNAIKMLGTMSVLHLGTVLMIAIVGGMIWQLVSLAKGEINPEHVFYVSVICLFWIGMVYLAMTISATLWNRFLLFGFVMPLPFAFLPFTQELRIHSRWLASIMCVVLLAAGVAVFPRQRPLWVTVQRPTEIKNVITWLKESPYRNDPLLVTSMGWQATYIPLYFPEVKMGMISPWVEDDEVYYFLKNQPPSLLITREGESELQGRIENIMGKVIAKHNLLHEEGAIKVYRLPARKLNVAGNDTRPN